MTFKEALKQLDIEDYGQRIFDSNSHGELFHLADYILLADLFKNHLSEFRPWFLHVVDYAEKHWQRPESVFQHMPLIIREAIEAESRR